MQSSLHVGDLHGDLNALNDAVFKFKEDNYNRIVFHGDYVDSPIYSDDQIKSTLQGVIDLKKEYPGSVTLLLGNHDIQYLHFPDNRCSSYSEELSNELHSMFNLNSDMFDIALIEGSNLSTHAGITVRWYTRYYDRLLYWAEKWHLYLEDQLDKVLNRLDRTSDRWILHTIGDQRDGYGYGGPTWADEEELRKFKPLFGYTHIVGHNEVRKVTPETYYSGIRKHEVVYINCLHTKREFFQLKTG